MDTWTGDRYAVYAHRYAQARYVVGMGWCCPCVHFVSNALYIALLCNMPCGRMRTG